MTKDGLIIEAGETLKQAAAEIRRLHDLNEKLELRLRLAESNMLHNQQTTYRTMERCADLRAANQRLVDALTEINNWLVCACVTTPEAMAQSFLPMQELASAALYKTRNENETL